MIKNGIFALVVLVSSLISSQGSAAGITLSFDSESLSAVGYYLNDKDFTAFPLFGPIYGSFAGEVNLGTCDGSLNFGATVSLGQSVTKHTLHVELQHDGVIVMQLSQKFRLWAAQNVGIIFPPVPNSPGEWKIVWSYASSANEHDTKIIKLLPPILAAPGYSWLPRGYPNSFDPLDLSLLFCQRGTPIPATYDSSLKLCRYMSILPSGFIYNNTYYSNAQITGSSCPFGQSNNNGCLIANAPLKGFVANNALYFRPFGVSPMHLIPPFPGGTCPAQIPSGGGQITNYPVIHDGIGCKVILPTYYWQAPFAIGTQLYLSERKTGKCMAGTFDGAHCFAASAPAGTIASAVGSSWYWTPRYCH